MASGEKTTALSNTEVEWAERTSQTAAKFKTVRKLNDLDVAVCLMSFNVDDEDGDECEFNIELTRADFQTSPFPITTVEPDEDGVTASVIAADDVRVMVEAFDNSGSNTAATDIKIDVGDNAISTNNNPRVIAKFGDDGFLSGTIKDVQGGADTTFHLIATCLNFPMSTTAYATATFDDS